jgi:zinc ribbon protein
MYCVFCGAENPEFASFCEKCGKSVNWKENQPSTERKASQVPSETERHGPVHSKFVPAQEQNGPRDAVGDTNARDFQKTYSEKTDEELLRQAGDMASLTGSARQALESELGKRGLGKTSIEEDKKEEVSRPHETAKDVPSPRKYRGLWILAWLIALLIFNVVSHWSQNAENNSLYIFLEALGRLTSPLELVLSAAVVFGILSSRETQLRDGEVQTAKKQLFSRNAIRTAYILAGTVGLVIVIGLVVASLPRGGTKPLANQAAQSRRQDEKTPVNPNALDNYEIMSKSKADLGTEDDGLSPEAKKRMREGLALQLAGAMQKQNNPIGVDIGGDNHDVLLFQLPSMNNELANELIQEFGQGDANFWNGARLMNFSQIDFSGDGFKKIVTRAEIIGYGKDYDKYKAAFLKATKGIQAGAQGELTKP